MRARDLEATLSLLARRGPTSATDADGNTSLHIVAEGRGEAFVTPLVDAGCPVNHQNKKGRTALMVAVRYDDHAAVEALLASGAKSHLVDVQGISAADYAAGNPLMEQYFRSRIGGEFPTTQPREASLRQDPGGTLRVAPMVEQSRLGDAITVRLATLDDTVALLELEAQHESDMTEALLRRRITAQPRGQFVAVSTSGELLGAVYLQRGLSLSDILAMQRQATHTPQKPTGAVVELLSVVQLWMALGLLERGGGTHTQPSGRRWRLEDLRRSPLQVDVPAPSARRQSAVMQQRRRSTLTRRNSEAIIIEVLDYLAAGNASGSVPTKSPASDPARKRTSFMEHGIDSSEAANFVKELNTRLGGAVTVSDTVIFEHSNVAELATYLSQKLGGALDSAVTRSGKLESGKLESVKFRDLPKLDSVRFDDSIRLSVDDERKTPHQCLLLAAHARWPCNDTARFCSLPVGGDAVGWVPSLRWEADAPLAGAQYGGFLPHAQLFDAPFFCVSSAEAHSMDPQHRLLLESGYAALHSSGERRQSLLTQEGNRHVGVFLGIMNTDFATTVYAQQHGSVYAATGGAASIAGGRLSFALGLTGPCISVDSACSSALVALHTSASALRGRECAVALTLAVNLLLSPRTQHMFARATMLSPDGRCKSFDARANGYARSEGVGAVALCSNGTLDPTLQQSSVCGTALGSRVRSDGKSASLTAPNGIAQARLIRATLSAVGVSSVNLVEAHGTGTALGDPTESNGLRRALGAAGLLIGGTKANLGHTEPSAGLVGLLSLRWVLEKACAAVNAQLRKLNIHLGTPLRQLNAMLPIQSVQFRSGSLAKGVSSFGYSGTIAHALIQDMHITKEAAKFRIWSKSSESLRFCRRPYNWQPRRMHPFAQQRLPPSTSGAAVFRSPASGELSRLVADHIVSSRVVFPAAAYLELARAVFCAEASSAAAGAVLRGVFFVQPLLLEGSGLHIECVLSDGQFEVRSGQATGSGSLADVNVHCSGKVGPDADDLPVRFDPLVVRCCQCMHAVDAAALYMEVHHTGLQYGPGYRVLDRVWGDGSFLISRVSVRPRARGSVEVHPADLDGALQLSIVNGMSSGRGTRLPFAVGEAQLRGGSRGALWASAGLADGGKMASVHLSGAGARPQAQLDGLQVRAVRDAAHSVARDLYISEWVQAASIAPSTYAGSMLLIGASEVEVYTTEHDGRVARVAAASSRSTVVLKVTAGRSGREAAHALVVVEQVLVLVQAQGVAAPAPAVWLWTVDVQLPRVVGTRMAHYGCWGLARTARVEGQLPLYCVDAPPPLAHGPLGGAEAEVVMRGREQLVPRLVRAPWVTGEHVSAGLAAASHLITGGTGGLGLLTGRWLAQLGAQCITLSSRSGKLVWGSAAGEWEALQASGVATAVSACDAAECVDVRRLSSLCGGLRLGGVWHAAGMLADGLLLKQTAISLARVYAPKSHGAWTLQLVAAGLPLRSCVLFSSVVALLGGGGQANYSAANACLDALSACRRSRGACSSSVQWGAWAEVGMAARGAARQRWEAMEASSGVGRIRLGQGLAALQMVAVPCSAAVVGVLPIQWSRMLGGGAAVPAFLSGLVEAPLQRVRCTEEAQGAACGVVAVSLESVLEMVRRTAGSSVDADAPLMEAGVDSLGAVELRNQLETTVGGTGGALPSTLMFDHPTARSLAQHLRGRGRPAVRCVGAADGMANQRSGDAVEVGGMALVGPTGVSSVAGLRAMISCGADAVGQVPSSRWNVESAVMQLDGLTVEVGSRVRHGAFLQGAELFGAGFFNVSPAEAAAMDPQQRLLLERGYAALHSMGLSRRELLGSVTAVNVGQWASEFGSVLMSSPAGRSVYASTSFSCSVTCGRVSFSLGLRGPCASYDTACSASLVASHGSVRALRGFECEAALSAGVNMLFDPVTMRSNAIAGFTSISGRSHTFDSRADGYARGEAIGAITYRRGGGTVSSGGVVSGSSVRQDGRSASLTAPNGQAQQELLGASLADACLRPKVVAVLEAHGTGTSLGDPIEAGAIAAVFLARRGDADGVGFGSADATLGVGSLKANAGHTEPGAGLAGILKLLVQMRDRSLAPNAQLRVLNPHVRGGLRGYEPCALPIGTASPSVREAGAPRGMVGGVSSFGYSGTIAHQLATVFLGPRLNQDLSADLLAHRIRRLFCWMQALHPFAQQRLPPSTSGAAVFRSPASGELSRLVADHIVSSRVVFPAAAYLELARAVFCAEASSAAAGAVLRGVFFVQPLLLEGSGLHIECVLSDGQFEVRSGQATGSGSLADVNVHCSGKVGPDADDLPVRFDPLVVRCCQCMHAVDAAALYMEVHHTGLQYGPGYRVLDRVWGDGSFLISRVSVRPRARGSVEVHPADLDGALQLSIVNGMSSGRGTRLPFAVGEAQLRGGSRGALWASAGLADGGKMASVHLSGAGARPQAQLDGLQVRAVRDAAHSVARDLYISEWVQAASIAPSTYAGSMLLIGASEVEVYTTEHDGRVARVAAASSRSTVVLKVTAGRSGREAAHALVVVEQVLVLVQAQGVAAPAPAVWLWTVDVQLPRVVGTRMAHYGCWGLARTARVEGQLPLYCVDAPPPLAHGPLGGAEAEVVMRGREQLVPRLVRAPWVTGEHVSAGLAAASHLITGGTGGLGLLTGRWLAQLGAQCITLSSRSGKLVWGSAAGEWEALQASGVATAVSACDAAECVDVRRLSSLCGGLRLGGVWHAAGMLADGLLLKQTAISLARVYAPKSHGAWTLQLVAAGLPLRSCVLFSSVVALLGGGGQANYSAANACLDALSACRRSRGACSSSVQWGAWAEVGMAARGAARQRWEAMEASSGVGRIRLGQGLAALQMVAVPCSAAVVGVLPIQWSRMLGGGAAVPAFLSGLVEAPLQRVRCTEEAQGAACGVVAVSLESVLEMVRRTAGSSVDADAPLMEAGVDSLGAVELRNQLETTVGGTGGALPSTLMFDHPTARSLAQHLRGRGRPAVRCVGAADGMANQRSGDAVEVGGMALVGPTGVSSVAGLRAMISCGADAVGQVPSSRWNVESAVMQLDGLTVEVGSRVRHGAFLQGAELFGAGFFNVSPAEAAAMDPQQRLLLERGYAALHSMGLSRRELLGSVTAVNVGQWASEFGSVLMSSPAGRSVYASTSFSCSVTCGRVSFSLGLRGPCASYDTACSASLVASHGSVRALRGFECEAALSAGVNMLFDPVTMRSNAIAGFTSISGRSHTFDSRADGYARGEAIGAITYRRGGGTVSSGGVVSGSSVRQDGRSASLTAPNGQAQQELLGASLADACLRPKVVAVLEAHGTGTSLGDPIEAGAIAAVFLARRGDADGVGFGSADATLGVGSLKANAGHTEPGAGLAGILKLLVQMRDRSLAPNAQLRVLNPHVRGGLRGYEPCALPIGTASPSVREAGAPRGMVGGVSSFGYSGTIANTIIALPLLSALDACFELPCFGPIVCLRRYAYPWGARPSTLRVESHGDAPRVYAMCWAPSAVPALLSSGTICLLLSYARTLPAELAEGRHTALLPTRTYMEISPQSSRPWWQSLFAPKSRTSSSLEAFESASEDLPSSAKPADQVPSRTPSGGRRLEKKSKPFWESRPKRGAASAAQTPARRREGGRGSSSASPDKEFRSRGNSIAFGAVAAPLLQPQFAAMRPTAAAGETASADSLSTAPGTPNCEWSTAAVLLPSSDRAAPAMYGLQLVLSLAQNATSRGRAGPLQALVITCGTQSAHPLRLAPAAAAAAHGGSWGLARVVRLEHSEIRIRSADVACGPGWGGVLQGLAIAVQGSAGVAGSVSEEMEAAWLSVAERRVARLRRDSYPKEPARDVVTSVTNGVYAITGGMGGLGLQTAKVLVARRNVSVILASRSGRVVRDGQGLAGMLQSLRSRARVVACDVGEPHDVRALLHAEAPLRGLLHAAGAAARCLLPELSLTRMHSACAAKSAGAWNMHAGLAAIRHEVHTLFSSVGGGLGNVGQACYAAANTCLDTLALVRRAHGLVAVSLQLPLVSGVGMGVAAGLTASRSTLLPGMVRSPHSLDPILSERNCILSERADCILSDRADCIFSAPMACNHIRPPLIDLCPPLVARLAADAR